MASIAPTTLRVQRSLVPGLMNVPFSRCPPARPIVTAAPPAFEFPELADSCGEGAAARAATQSMPSSESASASSTPAESVVAQVGNNVIVGGLYGLLARVMRPGIQRLAQRAGERFEPFVAMAGQTGTIAAACFLASLCKGSAVRFVGTTISRLPVIGGIGVVGQAFQFGLASLIGARIGALFAGEGQAAANLPVYLAGMCVMCNTDFTVGSGLQVACLSCSHACLCCGCVQVYLAQRTDCPLCRSQPINVLHDVVL